MSGFIVWHSYNHCVKGILLEDMRKQLICLILVLLFGTDCLWAIESGEARFFGADDLHLRGGSVTSFQIAGGDNILVFSDGFNLTLGDNELKSRQAVVWLNTVTTEYRGTARTSKAPIP